MAYVSADEWEWKQPREKLSRVWQHHRRLSTLGKCNFRNSSRVWNACREVSHDTSYESMRRKIVSTDKLGLTFGLANFTCNLVTWNVEPNNIETVSDIEISYNLFKLTNQRATCHASNINFNNLQQKLLSLSYSKEVWTVIPSWLGLFALSVYYMAVHSKDHQFGSLAAIVIIMSSMFSLPLLIHVCVYFGNVNVALRFHRSIMLSAHGNRHIVTSFSESITLIMFVSMSFTRSKLAANEITIAKSRVCADPLEPVSSIHIATFRCFKLLTSSHRIAWSVTQVWRSEAPAMKLLYKIWVEYIRNTFLSSHLYTIYAKFLGWTSHMICWRLSFLKVVLYWLAALH